MRQPGLSILLILLGAVAGQVLSATSAVRLSIEKLADAAERIVVGRVQSGEARWDDAKKGIWTHHEISVTETLKGDKADTLEVVTRGGTVGRVGQHVAGAGGLKKGERYVLFLWKDDSSRLRLVGMVQGAFKLTTVEGVERAANSLRGLTIIDPDTMKESEQEADKLPLDKTLKALKQEISTLIKQDEADAKGDE